MKTMLSIWRREMGACFLSPVAYVVMVVFLAMAGFLFLQMVEGNVETGEQLPEILFKVLVFFWLPILVTVITMRLFAEERRSGTLETLLTAPVTETEVVMGKFAGALSFLWLVSMPAVSFIYVLAFFQKSPDGAGLAAVWAAVDNGAVAGGCLIFLLISSFSIALGLVVSLMTRNQIVAAICCFCAVLVPLLAEYIADALPGTSSHLPEYVSVRVHLTEFARGSIDTRPLVFYVSGTVLMLFAAVRILESRKWR